MREEICGTCKYHKHIDDGWECTNEDSINAGCYTDYNDRCDDWEDK